MRGKKLLIVGCGDVGRRVALIALGEGRSVTGLVRSTESAAVLSRLGIPVMRADLLDAESLSGLPVAGTDILYLAPPPGGGISDPKIRHFCTAIPPEQAPARIVYLSTSGVYGDCGGAGVTEATPVNASTSRAKRRLDAETAVRQFGRDRGVPVIILRVTGIYGPHRFPLHRLVEGHPVLTEEQASFTNRIHADDLARVCLRALDRGKDGDIFNISDGQDSTMTDYFNAVADTFGLPRPPQVTREEAERVMNPLLLSYFQESRRMDNRKMLEKLDIQLLYPTLQEGLAASVDELLRENPDYFATVLGRAKPGGDLRQDTHTNHEGKT